MSFNVNTQVFPGSNCVYVDNDFAALRAKGLFAYRTLGEAILSWEVGGEARRKYGTPSATNRAVIILGAGTIISGETEAGGTCYMEGNDFLSIVGQGIDVTILTNTSTATDGIINVYTSANSILSNFTIRPTASATQCIKFGSSNWSGILSNLKLTGNPTTGFLLFNSFFLSGALIEDCIFDFSGQTGITTPFLLSATALGTIRNCSFLPSSSCPNAFQWNDNAGFIVKGCTFVGSPSSEMIRCTASFMSNPRFEDCHIEAFTGKGLVITTANTDPDITIENCNFICNNDNCLSITASNETRIVRCSMETINLNKDVIVLNTGTTDCVIDGCKLLPNGTGKSINSTLTLNIQVTNCILRKSISVNSLTGSSVASNIANLAPFPGNTELEGYIYPMGGLVSVWKMDETAGIRKDSFGENHLVPFSGVSYVYSDPTNNGINAAHFNHSGNQGLTKNSNSSLQIGNFDFTITTWVRFNSYNSGPSSAAFVTKLDDTFYEYNLYYYTAGSQVYWDVAEDNNTRLAEIGGPALSLNTWYFIVAWHDSVNDVVGLQVNNGTVFTATTTGGIPRTSTGVFNIGNRSNGSDPNLAFDGDIDETVFYRKVLTAAEKTALYGNGNVVTFPPRIV